MYLRSKIIILIYHAFSLLQDIDYKSFKLFMDDYLDITTPEELCRHLFISFIKKSSPNSDKAQEDESQTMKVRHVLLKIIIHFLIILKVFYVWSNTIIKPRNRDTSPARITYGLYISSRRSPVCAYILRTLSTSHSAKQNVSLCTQLLVVNSLRTCACVSSPADGDVTAVSGQ